jgi:hypothetical protein
LIPASPTKLLPKIVVTATPTPLVAVREPGAAASQYRITADLTFKETAGTPARITSLKVDIVTASGWSMSRSYDTDLPVTALGEARQTLGSVVDVPAVNESARWRLTVTGVDREGQAFDATPIETDLNFLVPTKPLPSIVVTASPTPLVAVREGGGAASQYRITAGLSFRETAGKPARITRLKVDIVGTSGWSISKSYDTDLAVTALGEARQMLASVFDVTVLSESGRWQLTVTGVDPEGQTFAAAPVEADVIFMTPAVVPDEVFVGAGDIAACGVGDPEATAKLLAGIPGTVFTLGDNVQADGLASEYVRCYDPTWGRHLRRTLPTVGNHDWDRTGGGPYFSYFGPSAGPAGLGYYSRTLGAWRIISLNSNIAADAGSAQYQWLKAELTASPSACTLVMWHHPLFSSGPNGNSAKMRDAWRLLNQFGADVVLNGHDHVYERFAPQDADARPSPRGIREFLVGTGGYSLYDRVSYQPNSEAFENRTWGVLKLTLKTGSYDWEFVPVAGKSFRDFGSAACVTQ